ERRSRRPGADGGADGAGHRGVRAAAQRARQPASEGRGGAGVWGTAPERAVPRRLQRAVGGHVCLAGGLLAAAAGPCAVPAQWPGNGGGAHRTGGGAGVCGGGRVGGRGAAHHRRGQRRRVGAMAGDLGGGRVGRCTAGVGARRTRSPRSGGRRRRIAACARSLQVEPAPAEPGPGADLLAGADDDGEARGLQCGGDSVPGDRVVARRGAAAASVRRQLRPVSAQRRSFLSAQSV
ncbi:MAG: hypothetical protein AVDCRST_MAG77-4332, partial [uncultured Chloroflexi bacterium]